MKDMSLLGFLSYQMKRIFASFSCYKMHFYERESKNMPSFVICTANEINLSCYK